MIPVHTKPEDSEKELDELYDVFLNVTQKWATDVRWRLCQWNKNHFVSEFCCCVQSEAPLNNRLIAAFP